MRRTGLPAGRTHCVFPTIKKKGCDANAGKAIRENHAVSEICHDILAAGLRLIKNRYLN